MGEPVLLRRGQVRERLGISEWEMRALVETGSLTPVYLLRGRRTGRRRGAPADTERRQRAFFRTAEVEGLTKGAEQRGD